MMVLVVGGTKTAAIDGISAAGATREGRRLTPAADAEMLVYGRTVWTPAVPMSPTGTPTPALVTRAVRDLISFDLLVVDAGLMAGTAAPTIEVSDRPGADIRSPEAVPNANAIICQAEQIGRSISQSQIAIAESIPGGTTTALGVMTALDMPFAVSSSLVENPLARKRAIVEEGLAASEVVQDDPIAAIRHMGDPVLAGAVGLASGALSSGTDVRLAGGTQMVAVAAVLRARGITAPIELATTSYVANDPTVNMQAAATAFDLDLRVTDPEFSASTALGGYVRGEGKEGVGMGGALAMAVDAGISMETVRTQVATRYEEVVATNGP